MHIELEYDGDDAETSTNHLTCSTDEVRTLWYALREYADKLEQSLKTSAGPNEAEDKMFLHQNLYKVYSIMFSGWKDHSLGELEEFAERFSI
jgi:hypothetical protein